MPGAFEGMTLTSGRRLLESVVQLEVNSEIVVRYLLLRLEQSLGRDCSVVVHLNIFKVLFASCCRGARWLRGRRGHGVVEHVLSSDLVVWPRTAHELQKSIRVLRSLLERRLGHK